MINKEISKKRCIRKRKPIVFISLDKIEVLAFESVSDAINYGFEERSIRRCLKGEYKQTQGYKVKFINEDFINLWNKLFE